MSDIQSQQVEFDEVYITSSEICETLDVRRSAVVLARQRGDLPEPIVVNGAQIHIWKREIVMPYIINWAKKLKLRRGY